MHIAFTNRDRTEQQDSKSISLPIRNFASTAAIDVDRGCRNFDQHFYNIVSQFGTRGALL
jgi:hypothetical protein